MPRFDAMTLQVRYIQSLVSPSPSPRLPPLQYLYVYVCISICMPVPLSVCISVSPSTHMSSSSPFQRTQLSRSHICPHCHSTARGSVCSLCAESSLSQGPMGNNRTPPDVVENQFGTSDWKPLLDNPHSRYSLTPFVVYCYAYLTSVSSLKVPALRPAAPNSGSDEVASRAAPRPTSDGCIKPQ